MSTNIDQIDNSTGRLLKRTTTALQRTITEPVAGLCAKKSATSACFADRRSYWAYAETVIHETITTDGSAAKTRDQMFYDPFYQGGAQYGNATQVVHSTWNGANFVDYRIDFTRYYPTVSETAYLVAIPGYANQYSCANTLNGACYTGTDPSITVLLASTWYLFDNHLGFNLSPTAGIQTGQRRLLYFSGGQPYFSDTAFVYDTWDNQIQTRAFTSEVLSADFGKGAARETSTTYDAVFHSRVIQQVNALGHITNYSYGAANSVACGIPDTVWEPNAPSTYRYDAFCRFEAARYPLNTYDTDSVKVTYQNYNSTSNTPASVTQATRVNGAGTLRVERSFYNGLGWLIQQQSANALVEGVSQDVIVDYRYGQYGNVIWQSVPYTRTPGTGYQPQTFTQAAYSTLYDPLGRVLQRNGPNGAMIERNQYQLSDTAGYRTVSEDAMNHQTVQSHNALGQVVVTSVTQRLSEELLNEYIYDSLGRLTRVERRVGSRESSSLIGATTIGYDLAGRKTNMTDPDMGSWIYGYDVFDNLISQRDARGCTSAMLYDALNRLRSKTFSGSDCPATPALGYGYDSGQYGIGQRTSMTYGPAGAGWNTAWSYDARGRMRSETKTIDSVSYTTQWTYFEDNQIETMTYPDGEVLTYQYTAQGQPTALTGAATYLSNARYDAAGRMIQRDTAGGALSTQYQYYPWTQFNGRLDFIQTKNAQATLLQDLQYEAYNADGNITTLADAGQTITYTYDALHRLISDLPGGTAVYSYDPQGRLSKNASDELFYTDTLHPNAVTTWNGNSYGYDANGNQTSRTVSGSTSTLSYDAENHLTSYSGAQNAQFFYDGDGQLVKTIDQSGVTYDIASHFEVFVPVAQPPTATPTRTPTLTRTPTPGATLTPTLTATPGSSPTPGATFTPTSTPVGGLIRQLTFEDGSLVHAGSGADSATGAVTLDSSSAMQGVYSARIANADNAYLNTNFSDTDDAYLSFYLKLNAYPSSNTRIVFLSSDGTTIGNLNLQTDGKLRLRNASTTLGSASAALVVGTLYRVGLRQKRGTGSDGILEAYLAEGSAAFGAPFASSASESFTTPADRLRFGATTGVAIDAWFDDFKLSSQSMPQARMIHPTASLLTSVFEQLWRWLRGWFGQPEAAALLSEPPAGRVWRSYYFVGSQRIALREQSSADPTGQVSYLLSDHLGSTTALVSPNGVVLSGQRYSSWGKTSNGGVSTAYQYTGQRNTGLGIYYYGARFFDPAVGRFLSADTIIPQPGNPQDWDRYSYSKNNPINYNDPSGHSACDVTGADPECEGLKINRRKELKPERSSYCDSRFSFAADCSKKIKSETKFFWFPMENGFYVSGSTYGDPPDHNGVDYASGQDPAPLHASADGKVVLYMVCKNPCLGGGIYEVNNWGYGNAIVIEYSYDSISPEVIADLNMSPSQSIYIIYAHMETSSAYTYTDNVDSGVVIGNMGSTGNSSGPHLHLAVKVGPANSIANNYSSWRGLNAVDPRILSWNVLPRSTR